jgi:hypothetical protein
MQCTNKGNTKARVHEKDVLRILNVCAWP